jgi:hypothetical protein
LFAFSEIEFEDLVWNEADINADFVDPIILPRPRDSALMEFINNCLCDQSFLGVENELNGGIVLRKTNIAVEQFYFFQRYGFFSVNLNS